MQLTLFNYVFLSCSIIFFFCFWVRIWTNMIKKIFSATYTFTFLCKDTMKTTYLQPPRKRSPMEILMAICEPYITYRLYGGPTLDLRYLQILNTSKLPVPAITCKIKHNQDQFYISDIYKSSILPSYLFLPSPVK